MIKFLTRSLICIYMYLFSNIVISNDDLLIDDMLSSEGSMPTIKMGKNSTIQDELDAIDDMSDSLLSDTIDSPRLDIPLVQEKKIKQNKPIVHSYAKEKKFFTTQKKLKNGSSQKQIITQRLLDWAQAWSQGDVDKYINFYDDNYSPAGKNRKSWIKNRRERISTKKNIKVDISDIQIYPKKGPTTIKMRFKQNYSSVHYQDSSYKLIIWKQKNSRWYISKEITVKK